jgi:hypothetical protein
MIEFKDLLEAVKVDTSRFERSHMKKPKGTGGWMFTNKRMHEKGEDVFQFSGSYADAKKAAKAWGKEKGYDYVYPME